LGLAGITRDAGAPGVAVLLLDLLDLDLDHTPAAGLVLEQRVDLSGATALLLELLPDNQNLESGQTINLQLENPVGLLGVEPEALHDLLRGVRLPLRLAHDLEDLVERVEDLLEAVEDVDALLQRVELVFEPLGDNVQPEVQEMPEDLVKIHPLRTAD